jgi:hypothetical protein
MNKHIELIKKWLAEPASVSLEELEANREAAWADWDAVYGSDWADAETVYEAAEAAYAAFEAAEAAEAAYWRNLAIKYIEKYEELAK